MKPITNGAPSKAAECILPITVWVLEPGGPWKDNQSERYLRTKDSKRFR